MSLKDFIGSPLFAAQKRRQRTLNEYFGIPDRDGEPEHKRKKPHPQPSHEEAERTTTKKLRMGQIEQKLHTLTRVASMKKEAKELLERLRILDLLAGGDVDHVLERRELDAVHHVEGNLDAPEDAWQQVVEAVEEALAPWEDTDNYIELEQECGILRALDKGRFFRLSCSVEVDGLTRSYSASLDGEAGGDGKMYSDVDTELRAALGYLLILLQHAGRLSMRPTLDDKLQEPVNQKLTVTSPGPVKPSPSPYSKREEEKQTAPMLPDHTYSRVRRDLMGTPKATPPEPPDADAIVVPEQIQQPELPDAQILDQEEEQEQPHASKTLDLLAIGHEYVTGASKVEDVRRLINVMCDGGVHESKRVEKALAEATNVRELQLYNVTKKHLMKITNMRSLRRLEVVNLTDSDSLRDPRAPVLFPPANTVQWLRTYLPWEVTASLVRAHRDSLALGELALCARTPWFGVDVNPACSSNQTLLEQLAQSGLRRGRLTLLRDVRIPDEYQPLTHTLEDCAAQVADIKAALPGVDVRCQECDQMHMTGLPVPNTLDVLTISDSGSGELKELKAALLDTNKPVQKLTGVSCSKRPRAPNDPEWVMRLLKQHAGSLEELQLWYVEQVHLVLLADMPRLHSLTLMSFKGKPKRHILRSPDPNSTRLQRLEVNLPGSIVSCLILAYRRTLREVVLWVDMPSSGDELWPDDCGDLPEVLQPLNQRADLSVTLWREPVFRHPPSDEYCASQLRALQTSLPLARVTCNMCHGRHGQQETER